MITCFDIETGPLPDETLQKLFEPTPYKDPPGEFDPKEVKLGNLKKQELIDQKIERAHAAWKREVSEHKNKKANQEQNEWREFKNKAALSAVTGRVLAVGYQQGQSRQKMHLAQLLSKAEQLDPDNCEHLDREERMILDEFWRIYSDHFQSAHNLAGHNILRFDVPFMIRRSWILGCTVPAEVNDGRRFATTFLDTIDIWRLGDYQMKGCSLNAISTALGGPSKPDDVSGADFSKLYWGSPAERIKALAYLDNDLTMTKYVVDALRYD